MATPLKKSSQTIDTSKTEQTSFDEIPPNLSAMEKMASIGLLTMSVAHEMRNLLGMMRNAAFNLDHAQNHSCSISENSIAVIHRSIHRAQEYIDCLLNFARVNPKKETVDIHKEVKNLLHLFSKELEWNQIYVEKRGQPLPLFYLDKNALLECMLNIIVNAIQSMPEGGKLTIEINPYEQGCALAIHDNGCGIPEPIIHKIFDRFYTTKKNGQGTGLGLTIVRNLARDMGGDVEVESQSGVGSTFTLTLPFLPLAPERNHHEA